MRTSRLRFYLAGLLASLCLLTALPARAAPVLVGHKGLAGEKLTPATLKAVLLGKKVSWEGSGRITLAVLKGGAAADEFLRTAVEMTSGQFNNHWRRLVMTGGGTPPKSFEKEEDLRRFVAETPGAVGFIDQSVVDATVSVLSVTP